MSAASITRAKGLAGASMVMDVARVVGVGAAVVGVGMLLGASSYESVVMAPNYSANIPNSLETARQFFSINNPGVFFRVLAPATEVLALVSTVLCWRTKGARWWMLAAFGAIIAADVITFTFHYPRNDLLFTNPLSVPKDQLMQAANEWAVGNYARIALLVVALALGMVAFSRSVLHFARATDKD